MYKGNNIGGTYEDGRPWTTDTELQWLYEQAKGMRSIVEIGSWLGRSTHALCTGCKEGIVYAVDHWQGNVGDPCEAYAKINSVRHEFAENMRSFHNLIAICSSSKEAAQVHLEAYEQFDMVFIDGTHTYEAVKEDIQLWLPKTKKLICGHDYDGHHSGLQKAVNEAFPDGVKTEGSIWYKWLIQKQ